MRTTPQVSSVDPRWAAVLSRDARSDNRFVYAVKTTGVYCRPTCPSRRPKVENVQFFATTDGAESAGFRACQRCRPNDVDLNAQRVRKAMRLLDSAAERITLAQLGKRVGLSPFHLQRVFKKVVGVSPSEYVRNQRMSAVREKLGSAENVTQAIYDAGFNSSSRFYENAAHDLGMNPARWRKGGEGERICFTTFDSPVGAVLIAATEKGICRICMADKAQPLAAQLKQDFYAADLSRDDEALQPHRDAVLAYLNEGAALSNLPLDLRGTAFQCKVWKLLREIPLGGTVTYSELARLAGNPSAARAIARACATNDVALVVPCHRVIGAAGNLSGYRWGVQRKAALLERERKSS